MKAARRAAIVAFCVAWVVYSVGLDGRDDGGRRRDDSGSYTACDFVF